MELLRLIIGGQWLIAKMMGVDLLRQMHVAIGHTVVFGGVAPVTGRGLAEQRVETMARTSKCGLCVRHWASLAVKVMIGGAETSNNKTLSPKLPYIHLRT